MKNMKKQVAEGEEPPPAPKTLPLIPKYSALKYVRANEANSFLVTLNPRHKNLTPKSETLLSSVCGQMRPTRFWFQPSTQLVSGFHPQPQTLNPTPKTEIVHPTPYIALKYVRANEANSFQVTLNPQP